MAAENDSAIARTAMTVCQNEGPGNAKYFNVTAHDFRHQPKGITSFTHRTV
jgi:hypothetical protein